MWGRIDVVVEGQHTAHEFVSHVEEDGIFAGIAERPAVRPKLFAVHNQVEEGQRKETKAGRYVHKRKGKQILADGEQFDCVCRHSDRQAAHCPQLPSTNSFFGRTKCGQNFARLQAVKNQQQCGQSAQCAFRVKVESIVVDRRGRTSLVHVLRAEQPQVDHSSGSSSAVEMTSVIVQTTRSLVAGQTVGIVVEEEREIGIDGHHQRNADPFTEVRSKVGQLVMKELADHLSILAFWLLIQGGEMNQTDDQIADGQSLQHTRNA